ncbi:MAG: hypothetical protein LQ340_003847 [Diploschistes diacapsis]|nr:MAG: hypothetical protein LQ340_003847 [Diploschistes diacapsis]
MAYQDKSPFAPQIPKDIASLIHALDEGTGRRNKKKAGGFSCRKSTFKVEHTTDKYVNSYKFNDWDYKRDDLPTNARGLFTYKRRDGTPEIAVRGYDKFFNVNEVNDTQWRNVEQFTRGPYELSVKENGCIIFIAGMEDDTLLVCSKHSTGARQDSDLSHAIAGERWIDIHLSSVGKGREDLARELRNRNVTAVAELCDDSFEEHVLEYGKETAGLYLHGMNLNLPEFATYSGSMVHKFADEWGFKKAQYVVKDDLDTVKTFLEKCAETGSWAGRDTEGFVIRCQKKVGGEYVDWFFKYKFDEPYLMYRQWREATKAMISGKAPRYKKHAKITGEYLDFARKRLAQNQGLAKAYNANHGIIKMRDDFLKERGLKGSEIIRQEEASGEGEVTKNIVLVPIASIGCGKTTVALGLVKLFGWGHIQNDNITVKRNKPAQFANQVCMMLADHPVVIADRNNHQRRERKQMLDDVSQAVPDAKFVALHYVHDPKDRMLKGIRQVTRERVLERGDNHQTIHAGSKSEKDIVDIMEGFLHRFEPLDRHDEPDSLFDEVIDLDVVEDSRHNLDIVVNALHKAYPKLIPTVPSSDELDKVIEAALSDYSPEVKHEINSKNNKKDKRNGDLPVMPPKQAKVEYFCLRIPTQQILSTLDTTFSTQDASTANFFHQLQTTRRVQAAFHVTLIHRASIAQNQDLWDELADKYEKAKQDKTVSDPVFDKCRVELERIVWDRRVMCVAVRLLDEGWRTANALAHVTVGTASPNIKPKESNDLLQKWAAEGATPENGIRELRVKGQIEVLGDAKAVTAATR